MYQVDAIPANELTREDRARWIAALDRAPFTSPLLHPDFALLVARSRPDVRILITEDSSQRKAFLPIHKRPFGLARPIGSVFSDYHAMIAEPGCAVRTEDLLSGAGLRGYRHFSMVTDAANAANGFHIGIFADSALGDTASLLQDRKPSRAKQLRRLERKLERDVGDVRLSFNDPDDDAFKQLLSWKSAQFAATGRHDVLNVPWARQMLDHLRYSEVGDLENRLVTLRAGQQLVSAEFGPSWNGIFHPWIAAYDADYATYSPGHLLVQRLLASLNDAGLQRYDLGPADAAYKSEFANGEVALSEGFIHAEGTRWQPRLTRGQGVINKLTRRWEQILLSETGLSGRLTGVAHAAHSLIRS
ncbi:MAG: polysaccharide biosynthesis protein CelD [Hyphobacterium sp.]|nr:MAG: polysaccharide biosynthesis protein CelD [Hyphobacterium sp.]